MLVAIVPARGGSKGVRNKNLRKLANKSLVKIAIEYASTEQEIDTTILTTDNSAIVGEFGDDDLTNAFKSLSPGKLLQAEENFLIHKRKSEHSGDDSPTIDAVMDVLSNESLKEFDLLLLLQPTSPFRYPGEIGQLLKTLTRTKTDSCVSARRFESPHPQKAFSLNEQGTLHTDKFESLAVPRQKLKELYIFDGAFYLTRIASIYKRNSLLAANTSIFLREGFRTLNIDDELDLRVAELLARDLFV